MYLAPERVLRGPGMYFTATWTLSTKQKGCSHGPSMLTNKHTVVCGSKSRFFTRSDRCQF